MRIKTRTYRYQILGAFCLMTSLSFSQVDSLKKEFQDDFDSFTQSIQQEFTSFQDKNDSIFLEFLEQSWKSFEAFKSESVMKPKPKDQPVHQKTNIRLQPIKPGNIILSGDKQMMDRDETDNIEKPTDPGYSPGLPMKELDFYGVKVLMSPPKEPLPELKQVSPMFFVEFFNQASHSATFSENIKLLYARSKELKLNDWGLICLLKTAAEELFQTPNEQTLFIWFGLIRCGYDVKSGYSQDKVYLLVPSLQDLYNTVYFNIKDKVYFLLKLDDGHIDIQNLNAYEADYPGNETRISLLINQLPDIPEKMAQRKIHYKEDIPIDFNENLVHYFAGYPDCDLSVSLSAPLSEVALKSIDKVFEETFIGMTAMQKTQYLLKLIQYGFPYKIDEEQFGKENYLFPEEALFFPYSDCEDRSALFARLVEHFTGLETIALCYDDHVTIAVNFKEDIPGSSIEFQGEKYYVCDPTYIGAGVGMGMPEYDGKEPDIVVFGLE